jgi:hypothetical protein
MGLDRGNVREGSPPTRADDANSRLFHDSTSNLMAGEVLHER